MAVCNESQIRRKNDDTSKKSEEKSLQESCRGDGSATKLQDKEKNEVVILLFDLFFAIYFILFTVF